MIVISYGVEKSGSTLAFEMAKAVLELDGHPQVRLPDGLVNEGPAINEVGRWSDDRLAGLIDATSGTRIAVRTHNPPRYLSSDLVHAYLAAGDLKIHVVFRDPRGTVVSMLDDSVRARRLGEARHAELRTVDDAVAQLAHRLHAFRGWGWFPSLRLLYDRFAFDPVWGPRCIADDLGVRVDPEEVWRIASKRPTRRNVARRDRGTDELWPDEVARIDRAFPLFLDLVRGEARPGWFEEYPPG